MTSSPTPPNFDAQGLPQGYRLRPDLEIAPRAAEELLRRGQAILLDCRTPEEHHQARIPGSILVPLSELEQRFDEVAEAVEEHPDRLPVVYCHHGVRSMRAASFLQARGIAAARSLAGGIDLWSRAVDPSIPQY